MFYLSPSFIDAGELSSFIWQHLGSFSALLAALEDLSEAVSKGIRHIEKVMITMHKNCCIVSKTLGVLLPNLLMYILCLYLRCF